MARIITWGHRGASGYETENTIPSFKKAIEMGVDGIELDVYTSQDGHVVVSHSDSVEIDGQRYRISKLSLEEIQRARLPNGSRIPTLPEVFQAVKPLANGMLLYSIDLKDVRDLEPYARVLDDHGVAGLVYTCMESRFFIKKAKRAHPGLKYVYSTHVNPDGIVEDLDQVSKDVVTAINIPVGELLPGVVDAIHAKGLLSFCWDAHDKESIKKAVSMHPDGIYSNYPDVLVGIVRECTGNGM